MAISCTIQHNNAVPIYIEYPKFTMLNGTAVDSPILEEIPTALRASE